MIRAYIQEISKMDVEISVVLKRVLILKPFPQLEGLEHLKDGYIQKDPLGVVYKTK